MGRATDVYASRLCARSSPEIVKAKPELKDVEPYKTILTGDRAAIAKLPMKDFYALLTAAFSGMSVDEFHSEVEQVVRHSQRQPLASALHRT